MEVIRNGSDKTKRKPRINDHDDTYIIYYRLTMPGWYNFVFSFILGIICIWAYKKTGQLLAPMIAHGGINIISIIYWIMVTK